MWEYLQPVTIRFGAGEIKKLSEVAKELNCKKGLLVSDPFFAKSGLANQIVEESDGVIVDVFSELSANPDVTEVDSCADIIRKKDIEFVVALGGGSALDCAKAASCVARTDDSIRKYHGTGVAMPSEHLPLIAVPTTAGTGSEVTCVSVLTDHENRKKAPINSNSFYPAIAIIDPLLTYSMPPKVTASTGIDVLCHAVEGYWSKGHQPICDALAIYASKLVFSHLNNAFINGSDEEAREKMAEASVIAGLAFTLPKTTSSHACSFPLTNIYHIPHGEACGLTLDFFMRVNAEQDPDGRIHSFAKAVGFKGAKEMADAIFNLKSQMGLRCDLKDLDLNQEQVDELVKLSHHPNLLNNPVEITDEILYDLYNGMR